jgi:hypothetical protein
MRCSFRVRVGCFDDVAGVFEEALDDGAQRPVLQRDHDDGPWANRQIDRQHFLRVAIGDGFGKHRDEPPAGKQMVAKVHG